MGIYKLWKKLPDKMKILIINTSFIKTYMACYRKVMKFIVIRALKQDKNNLEKQRIVRWLKYNPLSIFPYDYTRKYLPENMEVYNDEGFLYVNYKNHAGIENRIYAPKGWAKRKVQEYFSDLFMEQDKESPHAYFQDVSRLGMRGGTVADFGGAEGIFALEVVERAKKVYIFESDEQWLEPLRRTFQKWMDKVEIVHRYIGDCDDETTVRMDTFFDGQEIDCIKADIEGAEYKMLMGSQSCLRDKIKYVFMVGYHRYGDDRMICEVLRKYGFMVSHNRGYMIPWGRPDDFRPPYVRRGMIYGERV